MLTLVDKIQKAFGGVVPVAVRDRVNALRKGTSSTCFIRYDEVADWKPFEQFLEDPDIVLMDASEGVELNNV